MANLKEKYNNELRPALKEELGIENIMAVPKLTKVVINMGVGEAANDKKHLESALENLTVIAGQKPVVTKARQSVASFKIREGWPLGCKVTLEVTKCMISLKGLSTLRFQGKETLEDLIQSPLINKGIIVLDKRADYFS